MPSVAKRKARPAGPQPDWNIYRLPGSDLAKAKRLTTNDKVRRRLLALDRDIERLSMLLYDIGEYRGGVAFGLDRARERIDYVWGLLVDRGIIYGDRPR